MRIAVDVDNDWKVSSVTVGVRVGHLRASLIIDAGTLRHELPHEVLYALSERVGTPPRK